MQVTLTRHTLVLHHMRASLQTQLGSSSLPSLRVVPDVITSFHSNPVRNGTILALFLGQESIDPKSHVRRHGEEQIQLHMMTEKRREWLWFNDPLSWFWLCWLSKAVLTQGLLGCCVHSGWAWGHCKVFSFTSGCWLGPSWDCWLEHLHVASLALLSSHSRF